MKDKIHPNYGQLKVVFPNGESFLTKSTKIGVMHVDTFPGNHPAWNPGSAYKAVDNGRSKQFSDRYQGFFNK